MTPRAAALALLLACTGPATQAQGLPEPVLQALNQARLPASALAVAALPLNQDAVPWGVQAKRPMQPGSSMKLVTSIVALDRLGPNHRGFTELRTAAPLVGGTLQGDLALVGGGDVELGVPQLWALLVDLQQAGVTHITGQLLLDRTRYQPARLDLGLPPFDDAPEFPYNVIPDALNVAGSLLTSSCAPPRPACRPAPCRGWAASNSSPAWAWSMPAARTGTTTGSPPPCRPMANARASC